MLTLPWVSCKKWHDTCRVFFFSVVQALAWIGCLSDLFSNVVLKGAGITCGFCRFCGTSVHFLTPEESLLFLRDTAKSLLAGARHVLGSV